MRHSLLVLAAALALVACGDSAPPKPAPTASRAATPATDSYDRVAADGAGFTVGSMMAARTVYVFFDAQCPHCATLWREAKPVLGQVKMVWIPVRMLNDLSGTQGAAILSAQDPAALMDRHEQLRSSGGKGIEPESPAPKDALEKVRANTQLMSSLGLGSVPTLVYKDPAGKSAVYEGATETAGLRKLLGL